MRSTFSGLNTLVRGIYANQLSLDTVGHNISNASTEGYSRQRVNLSTTMPDTIYGANGSYQLGTGVKIESVTRARDTFMDRQYWKEASTLGYGLTSEDTLGKIEGIFHDELPDIGIQSIMNDFWSSWQTLATTASNDSARTAVRARGAELVDAIQHARDQLTGLVADVNDTLAAKVSEINQMSSEIFSLNRQISNIEVGGQDHANDLRDKRDLIVDKLSKMMNVRVYEDSNHNYIVGVSDMILADGDGYTAMALNDPSTSLDPDYGYEVRYLVVAGSNNQRVNFTNGEMKALQETNSTMVKGYLDQLSTMSQYLLQEFNATHRAGFGTDNSTNNNFFGDPSVNYAANPLATKGAWIDALSVNSDLYNTGGLAKIAAKTLIQNPVTQSNASGGHGSVGGTYTSTAYTSFQIRITNVTGTGQVDQASYTTDGGTTWNNVAAGDIDTSDPDFTVINNLPNGLNFTIVTDVDNRGVAAGYNGDTYSFSVPQGNASGDNATLLSAKLKSPTDGTSVLAGSSLDDYYKSMIGELGVQAQNRQRLAENQQTLIDQITNWRESVAGVNLDEEMSNMIRFQKGYNAAARVMTTVDEMLDKLINSTGIVGR